MPSKRPSRPRNRRSILRLLISPFQEFTKIASSGGILLIAFAVLALIWANTSLIIPYDSFWKTELAIGIGDYTLAKPLTKWINDGLMAIFFFVVGLEVKREILVGELSSLKQALFPIAAALGGMILPAALYALVNVGGPGARGWGIPMATDIAFALGILALLGRRVPTTLKVFLTAVAIVDDIGAVLVIAAFYTSEISWISLAAAGGLFVLLILFNRAGVRSPLPYAIVGALLWFATLLSGLHATIAGVLLAMTIPASQAINGRQFLANTRSLLDAFEEVSEPDMRTMAVRGQRAALQAIETTVNDVQAPLQRLEHAFHPWVAYAIMPIFALANAGVTLSGSITSALSDPITLGIVLGLVLGKQIGITLFAWLLTKTGLAQKPSDVSWKQIYGAGWLAGIGFTMSLFIANLAFPSPAQLDTARIGILVASTISAIVGWIILSRDKATAGED